MEMTLPAPLMGEYNRPVLTYSPHPLLPDRERELVNAVLIQGESIEQYLDRIGLLKRMGNQPFVLMINGHRVPRNMWSRCYPKPGTIINVCAIVRGGGGGDDNKIPRMITVIAFFIIAYMSFGTANGTFVGAVGGAGSIGAALAFAGTVVLGQIIATSLFPLPKPPKLDSQKQSPTYGVDGGSNQIRKYEPMPKLCGTNRFFPDFGSQPYTEFVGDDQVAYYVFDCGYNDLDLSDFKIGNAPLSDFTGVSLEQSDMTGKLTSFPANVDSVAGGTLSTALGPVTRTSSPNSTALAVEITGQLFSSNENGTIQGQVVGMKIEVSPTGQNQWTAVGFEADTTPQITPVGGIWEQLASGRFAARLNALQILQQGGQGTFLIVSASRNIVRRTFKFFVNKGQWDVRVTRVTPDVDLNDNHHVAQLVWSQLRSYQPDEADYNGRKRLALSITASGQLNGHIQQFSCLASAKCPVWVGLSNRAKVGQFLPGLLGMAWAGTNDNIYTQQATSNPAWWYLDAIRGKYADKTINNVSAFMPYFLGLSWGGTRKVYGAGQGDGRTDLENIKAFAAWCDQQGLQFNFVFDSQQSVFTVLQAIALGGRGTPSWGTGKLGVTWDAPNQPITAVFGMHNIIAGTFEVTYASENPPDVIEGEFINPDLDWQKDFVRVQVPGTNTQNNVKRIPLTGRTSKTLAAEDTNLYAAQVAYRNRRYKWQMDWEGFPCSRGDVGQLAHDLAALDYSGRFVDSTARRHFFVDLKFSARITTPHTVSQISQVLDIRAKWRSRVWQTGGQDSILDKFYIPGQQAYLFWLRGNSSLGFAISTTGSDEIDYLQTVVVPFANNTDGYVRVVWVGNNGSGNSVATFYTSNDGAVWTQLGLPITAAAATLFAGNTPPAIGTADAEAYWVEVRNTEGGTVVLRFDADYGTQDGSIVQVPDTNSVWTISVSNRLGYDSVISGSDSLLKLSRQVPLYSAGSFIVIIRPDGSFTTHKIRGGAGSTDTLIPECSLPFNPWSNSQWTPYDYRWLYGPSATPGKKLKIDGVRPVSERTVEINAIDELDYFYTAKSNPYTYIPPSTSLGIVELKSVDISVDGVRAGNGYVSVVTVTWDTEGDYDHAEVSLSLNGAPATVIAANERSRQLQFTVIDGTSVQVKVTVYSSLGVLGQTAQRDITQVVNFAALSAPADVPTFSLAGDVFSWTPVPDVDVVGYQIRFLYGTSSTWDSAVPLHDGLLTASPWTAVTLPAGQGPTTFLIKAIDAAGIYSTNPAAVVKDLGDVAVDNVYITYDFKQLGWKGAITNGFVDVFNHVVANNTVLMWSGSPGTPMWNADGSTPMYSALSFSELQYEDSVYIPPDQAGFNLILTFTGIGSPLKVEFTDNTNSIMWDDTVDSDMMWITQEGDVVPVWMAGYEGLAWGINESGDIPAYMPYLAGSDFTKMWAPLPDYKPWIGPVAAQSTVYDFRIIAGQGSVKGEVDAMKVLIDVPDVTQRVTLLVVPAGGIRIPLTEIFHVITVVSITLQHISNSQAVSAKWLDKDIVRGPLIQCFDTNNSPTVGVVNVLIEGY